MRRSARFAYAVGPGSDKMRLMVARKSATARRGTGTSERTVLGRKKRRFCYGALFADGHVERALSVVSMDMGAASQPHSGSKRANVARPPQENPRKWATIAAGVFLAGLSGCAAGLAELDNALDAEAARINAKTGTLVSYQHSGGGLDGPRTLGVITLRAGTAEEVAQAQIMDVEAAGFSAHYLHLPCGGQTGGCSFRGQSTVTDVGFETVAENTTTRSGLKIPAGMTGVIISLSAQPGRAVPTSEAARESG